MHIGFLTPEYVTATRLDGGLANYVKKVGTALRDRGHEITVIVASERSSKWEDHGISVHEVRPRVSGGLLARTRLTRSLAPAAMRLLEARALARVVWQIHRTRPFDVLQASSYRAPGYALLGNGRVPLVCRVSSYAPMLRAAYGRQRTLADHLTDWLEVRQVVGADAAFAPSAFMAEAYRRMEGCTPSVIRSPAGMDQDGALSKDQELPPQPYLLYFGTLSPVKGIDRIAQVLPAVLRSHPDVHMVFTGRDDGLPSGRPAMEEVRRRAADRATDVHYFPAMPKRHLAALIAGAVGVLMPSRVDNYPNACLEAQALGVPVVGCRDSSLEELIDDGRTGFLVDQGDLAQLEHAVERLLRLSQSERDDMGRSLRSECERRRAEDPVGQLEGLYRDTIAQHARRERSA